MYQGTSLGPLLYNIFSNDLSLYVNSDVNITQYADATQIIVTGRKRDLAHVIQRMQSALNQAKNQMKVNSNKTQLIVLGTRQMLFGLPKIVNYINGVAVEEVQ